MNKPLSQNSVQKIVENALRSWWISAKTTREKSIFIAEALCVTCRYSEEVSTVRVVDQITKVLSAKNNAGKNTEQLSAEITKILFRERLLRT